MNIISQKLTFLLLTASVLLTAGCSSGGGDGGTTNATITDDNVQALAIAGTEGVKQATNSDSVSLFAKVNDETPIKKLTVSLAQQVSQDPKFAEVVGICDSGTIDQTATQNGGSITYNNCVIGGATFNGSAVFTASTSGSITTFTIAYSNFTVAFESEVTTVDLDATCTMDSNAGTVSCTYNSTALGIDGRTYSVTNISVSGDEFSGFTISATVHDPDHGNITISTNSLITMGCTNGQPGSGEIVVSDGANSMTVAFNDCASYSVTYNGSTTAHNW